MTTLLSDLNLDLTTLPDAPTRQAFQVLLNLIATLAAANRTLREANQRLRDEHNRLQGAQGQPAIKPNNRPAPADHSAEEARQKERSHQNGRKVDQITIDRTEDGRGDPAIRPPAAEFKGDQPVVVPDLLLPTDNVLFRKEKWYAESTARSYLADLPAGYAGESGPHSTALSSVLASGTKVSEPQIWDLLRSAGRHLSAGTLSTWLIPDQDAFHDAKDAIVAAGLRASPWQHADDTAPRVNGPNQDGQIRCHPLSTAYRTTRTKDRLRVRDLLRNGRPRRFRRNGAAVAQLAAVGIAQITRQRVLLALPWDPDLDATTIQALRTTHLPQLGVAARKWIVDATAVAADHAPLECPIGRRRRCDDAPQLQCLTDDLARGWVHDGRQ